MEPLDKLETVFTHSERCLCCNHEGWKSLFFVLKAEIWSYPQVACFRVGSVELCIWSWSAV